MCLPLCQVKHYYFVLRISYANNITEDRLHSSSTREAGKLTRGRYEVVLRILYQYVVCLQGPNNRCSNSTNQLETRLLLLCSKHLLLLPEARSIIVTSTLLVCTRYVFVKPFPKTCYAFLHGGARTGQQQNLKILRTSSSSYEFSRFILLRAMNQQQQQKKKLSVYCCCSIIRTAVG